MCSLWLTPVRKLVETGMAASHHGLKLIVRSLKFRQTPSGNVFFYFEKHWTPHVLYLKALKALGIITSGVLSTTSALTPGPLLGRAGSRAPLPRPLPRPSDAAVGELSRGAAEHGAEPVEDPHVKLGEMEAGGRVVYGRIL